MTLPVLPACPPQTPEPRRLAWALLFSLLLHALLLFLVRFAPPSWQALSGNPSPLRVILDTRSDVTTPSPIAASPSNSKGAARVGMRDDTPNPERPLVSTRRAPVEQPRNDIPENFSARELLLARKPAQADIVESPPELLATQKPVAAPPEEKEKPYAPAPSVARPESTPPPPTEKLVSAEPVPGDKQDKLILAPPPSTPASKPETGEVKPVKIEAPKPEKVETARVAEPEKAQPAIVEKPKVAEAEKLQAPKAEEPPPPKTIAPEPPKLELPKPEPVKWAAEPAAARSEPAPETKPAPAVKSEVFRTAPAYRIPSLSELGIASIRKFAEEDGRKIKFGERGKTVGLKESDIRYAMYVESVRLKLQRIGSFNYPAAAARANLSGSLSVIVTLRADGSLEEFRIVQPSAYEVLNQGAERITRMSAPFSPFPDNIRQETEILNIRINWSFSNSAQSLD